MLICIVIAKIFSYFIIWYYKFSFKFVDVGQDKNVNYNYELFIKLTCNDIPKKYIKFEVDENKKISEYFRILIYHFSKKFIWMFSDSKVIK